jgi:hypothetical protein
MVKQVGFVETVKALPHLTIQAGTVKLVADALYHQLAARFGRAVVDLTPHYVSRVWGIELIERHARFWTAPCPSCDPGKPRITACPHCGNARRVTFA